MRDDVVIEHVLHKPVVLPICGNDILEDGEVCDYGVLNNDGSKLRCGHTDGTSTAYFNKDGVGSPYSFKASACIMQCTLILRPIPDPGMRPGPIYYHWADARRWAGDGGDGVTVSEDGLKTCTPE